jgi:hypothetical protein
MEVKLSLFLSITVRMAIQQTWGFHVGHVTGAYTVNMRDPPTLEQSENTPIKRKGVFSDKYKNPADFMCV